MQRLLLCLFLIAASPALANDSIAELKTGGLVFVKSQAIAMESEDLFISLDKVRVGYTFRNDSERDADVLVAFPMPDLQGNPYEMWAVPDEGTDNFLGFTASVDGKPVSVNLEQRAFAASLDVTGVLKSKGVPLNPYSKAAAEALERLPRAEIDALVARGIVKIDRYDIGKGMEDHPAPYWLLRSTYWWRMNFPAGRPVHVEHSYRPSVGGTAGISFYPPDDYRREIHADYVKRYCIDSSFERAIIKAQKAKNVEFPPFYENRISYILTTGRNWAGPIGRFRLTVDKGDPANLVSFCGKNIRKTGPTTFEMDAKDFYPDGDLDLLILKPASM